MRRFLRCWNGRYPHDTLSRHGQNAVIILQSRTLSTTHLILNLPALRHAKDRGREPQQRRTTLRASKAAVLLHTKGNRTSTVAQIRLRPNTRQSGCRIEPTPTRFAHAGPCGPARRRLCNRSDLKRHRPCLMLAQSQTGSYPPVSDILAADTPSATGTDLCGRTNATYLPLISTIPVHHSYSRTFGNAIKIER